MDSNLTKLAVFALKNEGYDKYTPEEVNTAVNTLIYQELDPDNTGDGAIAYDNFLRGKDREIYSIIRKVVDEVLPNEILARFGDFMDYSHFQDGDKPVYTKPLGKRRMRANVVSAARAGVYKAYRMDETEINIPMTSVGAAARIDLERMITRREDYSANIREIIIGIGDCMYKSAMQTLEAAFSIMPASNKATATNFDKDLMLDLISVASSYYGSEVAIYATKEFIGTINPQYLTTSTFSATPNVSLKDLEDLRETGKLTRFYGTRIIELEQTFVDENNTEKLVDPSFAYILPIGKGQKVIQAATEGIARETEVENVDGSREKQIYKKSGVVIISYNDWCIYQNTSLTKTRP